MDKILQELTEARTAAMKAQITASTPEEKADAELRRDTLRGVISEIDKLSKMPNPVSTLQILKSEYTKRIGSAEIYANAGAEDRSAREQAEADVLLPFIPQETSESDLREFIANTITEKDLAGSGGKGLGIVMGAVKQNFENYDGKTASTVARELLGM